MPTFTQRGTGSIADSVRSLLTSSSKLDPMQIMAVDRFKSKLRHEAASTDHQNALAEEVRLRADQARQSAQLRNDPNAQSDYAANASGMTIPLGRETGDYIRGRDFQKEAPVQLDDEGQQMPSAIKQRPAEVSDSQLRGYQSNIGALMGQNMATGKTNAEQLANAGGKLQSNALTQAVQDVIGKGDFQTASAMNQGAVPGHAIELFKPISNTGATIAPAVGAVNAAPDANPLIGATLREIAAKTALHGAQATNATASAGQHNAAAAKIRSAPAGAVTVNGEVDPNAPTLTGEEYLKTLPPGVAAQVKAMADGKIQFTPRTLQSAEGKALLRMAMQYDPGTDQTTYTSRAATAKDAASGMLAKSNNALNTVTGHLLGLAEAADKLKNTSYPWANSIKNAVLTAGGDPRVKEFNINMQGVANELERAYRGAGGTEADIKLWRESLASSSSPEQFKAVMAKGAEMLQSKLEANHAQYEQGMRGKPGDYQSITPEAKSALLKLRGQSTGATERRTSPRGEQKRVVVDF